MKIYFACSITGGRADEAVYQLLVEALLGAGHDVPTAMLADSSVVEAEAVHAAGEVYARDVAWIQESDALIAEVSTPSHGVGYEIGFALQRGKPVLCLHRADVRVSKMIAGNPHANLRLRAYRSPAEAVSLALAFAEGVRRASTSS